MDSKKGLSGHVPLELIDDLIAAGWRVLESDFEESAYLQWRDKTRRCLKALSG